jgi:hypothetical protein
MVDKDDIPERYGTLWGEFYNEWVDKYTQAFENQELHLGFYNKYPFPDIEERKSWFLEGMLLPTFLCLQPDVDSVEYGRDAEKAIFYKDLRGSALDTLLGELDKYLT